MQLAIISKSSELPSNGFIINLEIREVLSRLDNLNRCLQQSPPSIDGGLCCSCRFAIAE